LSGSEPGVLHDQRDLDPIVGVELRQHAGDVGLGGAGTPTWNGTPVDQQRVQLAAALVHDSDLLILDEPLAGLDPPGIDDIGVVLVERARAGCCVLFSSHQLDLVEHLCDSVVIIDRGRVVVTGKVDELLRRGPRRLAVRVEGACDTTWARGLPGVTLSEVDKGRVRLMLDESADSDSSLRAAMAAGRVTEFTFERRRLTEVFRAAMTGRR
jgi:ABC-2 type transport system ATP-binding protein